LDFQIYSGSVLNIEKDFVIQTEVMSQARLNEYGLQLLDTRTASDHFPKVTDLSFDTVTSVKDQNNLFEFNLQQNFPNPFNPETNIQYTIGGRQFVTLKVFDLLGKEIATIVNEEKPAGSYEVEFDGTDFPSGIYFYQLVVSSLSGIDVNANSFLETKKMILLK
jgi:hypothetical protein